MKAAPFLKMPATVQVYLLRKYGGMYVGEAEQAVERGPPKKASDLPAELQDIWAPMNSEAKEILSLSASSRRAVISALERNLRGQKDFESFVEMNPRP